VTEESSFPTFAYESAVDVRPADTGSNETWLVDQVLELHGLISGRHSSEVQNASTAGEPTRPVGEKV
jgi:hypothetical protein